MSFYRNTYLKSEEWKSFRNLVLVARGHHCEMCGFDSKSNDIHHLKYKRLFDVTVEDVRVLCRTCHDEAHVLRDKYPKMKKLNQHTQWLALQLHIWRHKRIGDPDDIESHNYRRRFNKFRKRARRFGWFTRKSLTWSDAYTEMARAIAEYPSDLQWAALICDARKIPMPNLQTLIPVSRGPSVKVKKGECPIRAAFFRHRQWMKSIGLILNESQIRWGPILYSLSNANLTTREWYDLAVSLGLETFHWPCGEH